MKKFWKRDKSAQRSWEEITAIKSEESREELEDVSDSCDEINDNSPSNATDYIKHMAKSNKTEKVAKKFEKANKIIDNLDFDPTVYYGWGDDKVDTWMQKLTKVWNVIASIMWFIFGSVTFAPILFTANKLDKFFNDKKKSFLISAIIYLVAIIFLFVLILF